MCARKTTPTLWSVALLAAISLMLLTSCGNPTSVVRNAVSGSCRGGSAKPLSRTVVLSALRKHGFSVRSSTTSDLCQSFDPSLRGAERPAFEISNEASGSYDEVQQKEGALSCILRRGPIWGSKLQTDLRAAPASPIFNGRKARFWFENLECTLYPGGDTPGRQVTR